MNDEIEALIRARVIAYHEQYPPGYWDDYKLCVITGNVGHSGLPIGTITIARYFPATFLREAHCLVLNIQSDYQSKCNVTNVNDVKFCK